MQGNPGSTQIGLLVFGLILILIGLLGGNFKLFGAEISTKISTIWVRWAVGIAGLVLVAYTLKPPSVSMSSRPAENTDRTENDFSNFQSTIIECSDKCSNIPQCTAYAYRASDRTCFLKRGEGKGFPTGGISSGVKLGLPSAK
jgi:hypothetical protein